MSTALLPVAETVCHSASLTPRYSTCLILSSANPRLWVYPTHTPLATHFGVRPSSSMTSESFNSSQEDVREHHQHRPNAQTVEGTPYAARAAAGAAAARSFFPLGYREGFSQWVSFYAGQTDNLWFRCRLRVAFFSSSGLVFLLPPPNIRFFPIFRICITSLLPTFKPETRQSIPTEPPPAACRPQTQTSKERLLLTLSGIHMVRDDGGRVW